MRSPTGSTPVVGVLACTSQSATGTTYSHVNRTVVRQLARHADVAAVLIPATEPDNAGAILSVLDGLVLPGGPSFLHPATFDTTTPMRPDRAYDPARDAVASALLAAAAHLPDLPVLGSCRGMQEIAVHSGGLLCETDPTGSHRRLPDENDDRWGPAHPVTLTPGGHLANLLGQPPNAEFLVNSQHSQIVDRLPTSVCIEAVAPDGVIEAIAVDRPHRFVLGVQWHFEQHTARSPLDLALLAEFGRRCRIRHNGGPAR
ncbi:gamma-glutamyl-gamma-aminobutyrate hydrolase family protein [Micromonospora sp. NPDC007208]|uniref:gamma-glutamyl-gamma-aminobutyrate hydrolase family protein n=1 Tax=Micromonospora sp. NPDC007208 TaxID=3364236 RepID=UPI0036742203